MVNDYTPTTEEVRAGYSTATYDDSKAEAEFDRWLAEVKAEEREKVVELIRRQAEGSQLEGDQKAVTLYEGLIAFIYIQNPYRQENHATDSD